MDEPRIARGGVLIRRLALGAVVVATAQVSCNAIFELDELPLATLANEAEKDAAGGTDPAPLDGSTSRPDGSAAFDSAIGLPPGTKPVFLSRPVRPADFFVNRLEADKICSGDLMRGTAVAWLSSTGGDAIDHLSESRWVNLRGEVVFATTQEIIVGATGPHNQIYPLTGTDISTFVWTGTGRNGRVIAPTIPLQHTCDDWRSTAGTAVVGDPSIGALDKWKAWTQAASPRSCSEYLRLYCFEV